MWKRWHRNGVLAARGRYYRGRRFGVWIEWNDRGQLVSRCRYNGGRKNNVTCASFRPQYASAIASHHDASSAQFGVEAAIQPSSPRPLASAKAQPAGLAASSSAPELGAAASSEGTLETETDDDSAPFKLGFASDNGRFSATVGGLLQLTAQYQRLANDENKAAMVLRRGRLAWAAIC